MKYNEAIELCDKFIAFLKKEYCINAFIVGSLKRRENDIHDIDLVTTDKIFKTNKKFFKFKLHDVHIPINIWRVPKSSLKFAKIMLTFNKNNSIVLRAVAKKRGYLLNNNGIYKDGKPTKINNKKELLKLLDIHHIK